MFPEGHPANPTGSDPVQDEQRSSLREYALPSPRHPLSDDDSDRPKHEAHDHGGHETTVEGAEDHSNHEALYVCVMHPQIVSATEGRCPICDMKLTPKDESSDSPNSRTDE